jgi:hypothetical protein
MPDDPTPLGDAMTHRFANQKIPDPKPNVGGGQGGPAAPPELRSGDISERPALPDHPKPMADIEDEEADPVIDTGPGIDDGARGPTKQRG